MKSNFNSYNISEFGNVARDNVLSFQLQNDVAATLTAKVEGDTVLLRLYAKNGTLLSESSFLAGAGQGMGLISVTLNEELKALDFLLADNSHIYCSLVSLYNAVQGKQNKLVSGRNIKTINNISLLGSENISLPSFEDVDNKQDRLEQGDGIKLENNTISVNWLRGITYEILSPSTTSNIQLDDTIPGESSAIITGELIDESGEEITLEENNLTATIEFNGTEYVVTLSSSTTTDLPMEVSGDEGSVMVEGDLIGADGEEITLEEDRLTAVVEFNNVEYTVDLEAE